MDIRYSSLTTVMQAREKTLLKLFTVWKSWERHLKSLDEVASLVAYLVINASITLLRRTLGLADYTR
jgi:hypothetical protein